jgi:hypothetical protein
MENTSINRKINFKGNYAHMYGHKNVQYIPIIQSGYDMGSSINYESCVLLVKKERSSLLMTVTKRNAGIPRK